MWIISSWTSNMKYHAYIFSGKWDKVWVLSAAIMSGTIRVKCSFAFLQAAHTFSIDVFLTLTGKPCCGYSLESSYQDSSNECPQHISWRNKERNICKYPSNWSLWACFVPFAAKRKKIIYIIFLIIAQKNVVAIKNWLTENGYTLKGNNTEMKIFASLYTEG